MLSRRPPRGPRRSLLGAEHLAPTAFAAARSLPHSHSVADPTHGPDEPRRGRLIAEFASQMPDVDIDQVVIAHPVGSPHLLDELAPGEDHVRAGRQRCEYVELGARQLDSLAVEEHLDRKSTRL